MQKRPTSESTRDDKFLNALAEAFRLQEAILNTTELPIFSFTPDGIVTSFNKAAENLLGYRSEELIGKLTPMVFHDVDEVVTRANELSRQLDTSVEPAFDVFTIIPRLQRVIFKEEWTLIKKDSSRIPAIVSISMLGDDHDNLIGYIGIITDIRDIKTYDERIRSSEQKFRLLAENIPGAIYLCEPHFPFKVIYVNEHIEKITGYPVEDFLSNRTNVTQLFHPEDVDTINRKVQLAIEQKKKYHLRYRMKHRSGEWRWIDEVGIGVFVDGKLNMLEGFLSDITPQREAEEKLQRIVSENLRVFNNSVNLNVVAGYDGFFKRVSNSWTTILGWSEIDLLSRNFLEFVHPDDVESTTRVFAYVCEGNNHNGFENRYRCKDGSYRWLLWSSASDPENEVVYASASDITERKKSEEQLVNSKENIETIAIKLQEQNKKLDEFAHIISHNLRSPIGNIQALINLLGDESTIEEYKVIFEKLKNTSKNLGGTMNDLMETLKVKTKSDLERVEIRFKDLLDKVIQSLEGELITAEASVTYDFNKAPNLKYPKAYLESIFQNLLSNAIKYRSSDRQAKIHFESQIVGDSIELTVSDNGQGIDMDKFGDKLFGLHSTFHSHQEARGVGLFLIKTQIESMGGSISAKSEVGKGTTFVIRFS